MGLEFLLCFALAAFLTGGRSLGDIIHAVKGTTPPRIERARLKAAARPAGSREPGPFREYASAVWRDAWTDAKAHHERARREKRAGERPTAGERARRLWRLLIDPVGEPRPGGPAVIDPPAGVVEGWADDLRREYPDPPSDREGPPDPWTYSTPAVDPDDPARRTDPLGLASRAEVDEALRGQFERTVRPVETPDNPIPQDDEPEDDEPPPVAAVHPNNNGGTPMTTATGEVQTYEQHKAEIAEQRRGWQTLLDLAAASVASVAQAKSDLNAQADQARALAAAAQAKSDGLAGAGLDVETLSHAGTQADAVDVNKLNDQFEELEQIEADVRADQSRAEAALAALDAEERTIDAKYGDAHATVAADLGGNAAYLESGGGGTAGPAMAASGSTYLDGPAGGATTADHTRVHAEAYDGAVGSPVGAGREG